MKNIYLDYAATTPVDPRVLEAMTPYMKEKFGNANSLHRLGQEAKVALEKSRGVVAALLGAKPGEVIFTSSATESNNLALKGVSFANKEKGKHIVISSIEHDSVVKAADWLEKQGFRVTKVPTDKMGVISRTAIEQAIEKDTILVSIIHASNEIGTIQPIEEIGKLCGEKNVYFHVDAAQSFGKMEIDVQKMNITLLTASSHKMYGPKGAACLYVREGVKIEPLLHGGGQEMGLRSSTVNVSAIVGFAKACELCKEEMNTEGERVTQLRDTLIENVLTIQGAHLNGHRTSRLPNNTNFWFEGVEGESLVIKLDLLGIASSTGSACSTVKLELSHVLLAIGLTQKQANSCLRMTLGRWTTEKEIDQVLKVLPEVVEQLRAL